MHKLHHDGRRVQNQTRPSHYTYISRGTCLIVPEVTAGYIPLLNSEETPAPWGGVLTPRSITGTASQGIGSLTSDRPQLQHIHSVTAL